MVAQALVYRNAIENYSNGSIHHKCIQFNIFFSKQWVILAETLQYIYEGLTMILQKYTVTKSGKSPIPSDICNYWLHIRSCTHIGSLYQHKEMCECKGLYILRYALTHMQFDQKLSSVGMLLTALITFSQRILKNLSIPSSYLSRESCQ